MKKNMGTIDRIEVHVAHASSSRHAFESACEGLYPITFRETVRLLR